MSFSLKVGISKVIGTPIGYLSFVYTTSMFK